MFGVGAVWPVPYGTLIITMTVTPTTLQCFWGCMDEWNGHCYMVAVGWLTWRSSWHCHKRILLLRTRVCRKDKYFLQDFLKDAVMSDVICFLSTLGFFLQISHTNGPHVNIMKWHESFFLSLSPCASVSA